MKKLLTYSLAAAMAIGSCAAFNSAWADSNAPKKETAEKDGCCLEKTKVSEKGFAAMQTIHAARLAIFNGETDAAKEMLDKANGLMQEIAKENYQCQGAECQVPINGSITLDKSFVPGEKHASYLAKANECFQRGQKAEGMEQLKQGEIAVNFARVLMPYDATAEKLNEAIELANQSKYYQTNLTLKAAEEGMDFDSVSLFKPAAKQENSSHQHDLNHEESEE